MDLEQAFLIPDFSESQFNQTTVLRSFLRLLIQKHGFIRGKCVTAGI